MSKTQASAAGHALNVSMTSADERAFRDATNYDLVYVCLV
jgi:hypothetical protein